ncbi:MAG: immunoglobulin domain-containing protein [Planctomycetes bacterium]|nr:immunoglobulin domain-containing protein [Planctomycetota bacterium]
MRVAHSLPYTGLGLALLATFGVAGQSKQSQFKQAQQAPQARPSETSFINPVSASWSDLLEVQAALPKMATAIPEASQLPIELPPQFLPLPGKLTDVRGLSQPQGGGAEPLVLCPSLGAEPALDLSFPAQADVPGSLGASYIPPSASGDVGPAHLMTMMSNNVQIQDRVGGVISMVDLDSFWSPTLIVSTTQGRVSYDALSGRWIATARGGALGGLGSTSLLFAISDTSDPTLGWDFYTIVADAATTNFPDWIPHGTNATWVTVTANMFTFPAGALAGVKMWVIDMATALAGGPITVHTFATGFLAPLLGGATGNSFTACTSLDTATTDMWVVNTTFGATGTPSPRCVQLVKVEVTPGPIPVASGLPGSPFGGTTSLCFVSTNFSTTQPTGAGGVGVAQVGDLRFMAPFSVRVSSAVFRNGKIWVAHQGGLPLAPAAQSRVASFWHQLDPTLAFPGGAAPAPNGMLLQDNVIDGGVANSGIMMPGISVNCGDDAVIGFSRFDATRNPESGYVVRVGSDPVSAQGPMRLLKSGDSSYWKNFGVGTTAQWGLHSATGVDPVDDKTFWTLQEHAALRVGPADNDSRWGTQWGRIGECGEPTIFDDPDAASVCVGGPATFSVGATPFLAPIGFYQWRKNGVSIPGATASSYTIPSTVAGDGGTYDVLVTDGCGTALSAPALLDFTGAVVGTHPAPQNVSAGDAAAFFITATGTGPITYSWRKNGVPLVPAQTSNLLLIYPVHVSDVGTYDCVATDLCGPGISNTAVLSCEPKNGGNFDTYTLELQIYQQPLAGIACQTGSHTLSVGAYGEGLSYVWRKGGSPIVPPETNSTLVLNPIVPGDEDFYDVIVMDVSGSILSDSVFIEVSEAPSFTLNPVNASAPIGGSASFTVVAIGDPFITYQWLKGGLQGPLFAIPGSVDATHNIPVVGNSHAGRYQCRASNDCGPTLSTIAKLTITL